MADKAGKPKKSKAKAKEEQGVLAALPSTRPHRIGGRRASAPKTFETPAAAQDAATEAKPAAKRTGTKKRAAAAQATAARRRAAAPRTFEPTLAAGATATAEPGPRPAPEPRPRAVREGAPGMGTSGARERAPASAGRGDEPASPEHGRPSGVELVTTAVQAAGELTQIGLTIGGQIVKRAVERLPKP